MGTWQRGREERSEYALRFDLEDIHPLNMSFIEKFIYRRSNKPAFIVGTRFEIRFSLKNVGNIRSPGGEMRLSIEWTSGRTDYWEFDLPALSIGESTDIFSYNFGIIEHGYGVISVEGWAFASEEEIKKPRDERVYLSGRNGRYDVYIGDKYQGCEDVHIGSVFGQMIEEFYQYWAMILAAFGLLYLI